MLNAVKKLVVGIFATTLVLSGCSTQTNSTESTKSDDALRVMTFNLKAKTVLIPPNRRNGFHLLIQMLWLPKK